MSQFQTVFDLTGTRYNGLRGAFYDLDYSDYGLRTTYRFANGRVADALENFLPVSDDPTGRIVGAYRLGYQIGTTSPDDVLPGGITFGPSGFASLGYVANDAPNGGASALYRRQSLIQPRRDRRPRTRDPRPHARRARGAGRGGAAAARGLTMAGSPARRCRCCRVRVPELVRVTLAGRVAVVCAPCQVLLVGAWAAVREVGRW